MRKIIHIAVLLLLSFSVCAQEKDMYHYTLDNGIEVIVIPEHRAPLAWFQIWYNVGSSDEINGKTGLSHALEHMMFKGTKKYPNGAIWNLVSANGGAQNAFTSRDYTCYWQMFPSDKIALSFDIESDRMQNLLFVPDEFAKEKQVILEERRMRTDDNPNGILYEQYMATINVANNYQNPVIGWARDIRNLNTADLQTWYNKWYSPNNAIIVVAGDVDEQNILSLAKQYFAHIPSASVKRAEALKPIPQPGKKIINVDANATIPSITFGYIVPSLVTAENKKEIYALTLLSQILTGGDSAVLVKDLVRGKQVAASVSSYYSPFTKYATNFTFSALPNEKSTIPVLEQSILHAIDVIKNTLLSNNVLNRAKAQIYSSEIYTKESIEDRSLDIGSIYSIGLTKADYEAFLSGIEQVEAIDIQNVVKKYFIEDKSTIAYLHQSRS